MRRQQPRRRTPWIACTVQTVLERTSPFVKYAYIIARRTGFVNIECLPKLASRDSPPHMTLLASHCRVVRRYSLCSHVWSTTPRHPTPRPPKGGSVSIRKGCAATTPQGMQIRTHLGCSLRRQSVCVCSFRELPLYHRRTSV